MTSFQVRTVDEYDPVRDVWISAPNMEARRSTLGVAMLNDHIYAVVRELENDSERIYCSNLFKR